MMIMAKKCMYGTYRTPGRKGECKRLEDIPKSQYTKLMERTTTGQVNAYDKQKKLRERLSKSKPGTKSHENIKNKMAELDREYKEYSDANSKIWEKVMGKKFQ